MFKKITLENGLRIITVPQKTSQAVTVLALVGTGSKYEKKEINGISHFLEHMYFKGTKKQPTTMDIAQTMDKLGGLFNAFTGEEFTGYFAKVSSQHFETALDWVSDIFLNSVFPKSELEKEKGVIIEEINMVQDHPMEYVQTLWPKLLYGDQPAGWDIAGTKESVSGISREKIIDYMKSQYVASNTIICVAGNIKEAQAVKKIKKYFLKINKGEFVKKLPVVEKQEKPEILMHSKKTDQAHFCLGVRGYDIFHPQRYAFEILGTILGGMMSSRLFEEIRSKLGIAYYVGTSANSDPDTGSLSTRAGVDNNKIDLAITTVLKEYKKISQKKVPAAELKKAKDYIKGKTILYLESSDALASFYSGQDLLEKKILTPKQIFSKIDKVTQNDILKVAKDIFRPEKLNLALIGPFENKLRFEKILTI
jgi:predicted Zn-dependent peptidase